MLPDADQSRRNLAVASAILNVHRRRIFGLTPDAIIRYFFQGNATVAIVVLLLITVFLFREGSGFFGENLHSIRVYRRAGLEYVDLMRRQLDEHTTLIRKLYALRLAQLQSLTAQGVDPVAAEEQLQAYDAFATSFGDAVEEVRGLVSELTEVASGIKQRDQIHRDALEERRMLEALGKDSSGVALVPVDFAAEVAAVTGTLPMYRELNIQFAGKLEKAIALAPTIANRDLQLELQELLRAARNFAGGFPRIEQAMQAWRWDQPVPWHRALSSFIFGRQWLTASFWQDWYGIIPLLVGSLLVSVIALSIAVPLGVSAAIYVSEIAGAREKNFIKPYIEFISAIPSVVLGFFGVAVLGEALRALSRLQTLSWVPGFPMSERLNSLTAGCLLALMAVPTIFSLAEDAINNVPRHLKEASYALGANRFQTLIRILIPASLSGIISAILLGFGRVVGETMVVLLCAGNRIEIPDFTEGLGAFFQPVHTMTGIIAQEMGEVVPGSIHYRALFMVGIVLFLLALSINYVAQKVVSKYRISIG